jgi:kumamolisin
MYRSSYYEPWEIVRLTHHSKVSVIKLAEKFEGIIDDNLKGFRQTTLSNYYPNQIAKIYGFPKPTGNTVIGIIGLSGTVDTHEIMRYWTTYCKIPATQCPKIVIVSGDRTSIDPNVVGFNRENTMDIEIVGGCCANDKHTVTIVLYHAENSIQGFYSAFQTAIYDNKYNPTVITCSWGVSEMVYTSLGVPGINQMKAFDTLFQKAVQKGINICCATGDLAASDGIMDGFPHVDFPSSSPNVISCGGTTLASPNGVYDLHTIETVWSFDTTYNTGTGAGLSSVFSKPAYQNTVLDSNTIKRGVCDISCNANPSTGYKILFADQLYLMGGTSCSAPVFASFLACCGMKKFANPILYANKPAFHTISSGSNGYYHADQTGKYSLCSGLGTPSSELANVLISASTPHV